MYKRWTDRGVVIVDSAIKAVDDCADCLVIHSTAVVVVTAFTAVIVIVFAAAAVVVVVHRWRVFPLVDFAVQVHL